MSRLPKVLAGERRIHVSQLPPHVTADRAASDRLQVPFCCCHVRRCAVCCHVCRLRSAAITCAELQTIGVRSRVQIDQMLSRAQIAIVSQEPVLFADTILYNICFGMPHGVQGVPMAQARALCRRAPFRA